MTLGRFEVERGEGRLTLRASGFDGVGLYAAIVLSWAVATELGAFLSWKAYIGLSMFLAVLAWFWTLVRADRIATDGFSGTVRRLLDIRPADATGYREATGPTLTIDEETFEVTRARAVFLRRRTVRASPEQHHVVLALDDRVFEVDSSSEKEAMLALAEALRETLELRAVEVPKGEPSSEGGGAVLAIFLLSLIVQLGVVIVPCVASGRREPTLAGCVFGAPAVMAIAWGCAQACGRLSRDRVRRDAEAIYGITTQAGGRSGDVDRRG
jgi:hypothetical protein